jgi:hypothetical protein
MKPSSGDLMISRHLQEGYRAALKAAKLPFEACDLALSEGRGSCVLDARLFGGAGLRAGFSYRSDLSLKRGRQRRSREIDFQERRFRLCHARWGAAGHTDGIDQ